MFNLDPENIFMGILYIVSLCVLFYSMCLLIKQVIDMVD